MTRSLNSESGSAILFVLWAAVLVAVLTAGIVTLAQNQLRLTGAIRDRVATDTVLRSALELAAYDVATGGRATAREFPREYAVQGRRVRVERDPRGAVLDINLADEESLTALLVRVGQAPTHAQRMAQRILDWRDNDERRRAYGAERGDYPAEALAPAANRPFNSVAELGGVLGMSTDLLQCLAPRITVFGSTPRPESADYLTDFTARADGMRLALRASFVDADVSAQAVEGVVVFGQDPRVPYQWLALASETVRAEQCSSLGGSQ